MKESCPENSIILIASDKMADLPKPITVLIDIYPLMHLKFIVNLDDPNFENSFLKSTWLQRLHQPALSRPKETE